MRDHYSFALLLSLCVLATVVVSAYVDGKHGMKLGLLDEQATVVGEKVITDEARTTPSHAVAGNVDVVGTIQSRLGTMYTALKTLCCDSSQCSKEVCHNNCPGSCWVTGWKQNPELSLVGFSIDAIEPAFFTPSAIVAQNYTNYSKKDPTSQTFQYSQSFSDTVEVSNTNTLTVSASVTASVKILIADVSTTVGFSYETSTTTTKTTTRTQQWSTTFGPITIEPCEGVYTECYILAATYNPHFTATYRVDGWPNDQCNGNMYWNSKPLANYSGYNNGVLCNNQGVYANPPILFSNDIVTDGVWTGVFGTTVKCSTTPYSLPASQCR